MKLQVTRRILHLHLLSERLNRRLNRQQQSAKFRDQMLSLSQVNLSQSAPATKQKILFRAPYALMGWPASAMQIAMTIGTFFYNPQTGLSPIIFSSQANFIWAEPLSAVDGIYPAQTSLAQSCCNPTWIEVERPYIASQKINKFLL